jgi:SAM-dependent methyltransferase
MEWLLEAHQDPIGGMKESLNKLALFLRSAQVGGFETIAGNGHDEKHNGELSGLGVEQVTGDHYGNLFKNFSPLSYWDEPVKLLEERLVRNGIDLADIKDKKVLDSGCGGGRYSVAWRLLGAKPVVGLDISPINVNDARSRVEVAKLDGIQFQEGNVLDLPFESNEFDIVFSNGVLHHTTDWERGVCELLRVLKPGGLGWLYLIEKPGGVFWDTIEILRVIMREEDKSAARKALQLLGIPANRVFYMLDHVMVPINLRLTPDEVEESVRSAGATNIRRLTRGAGIDRVERIYNKDPWAVEFFGAGENRYVFTKAA